jgi:hypothetical protein
MKLFITLAAVLEFSNAHTCLCLYTWAEIMLVCLTCLWALVLYNLETKHNWNLFTLVLTHSHTDKFCSLTWIDQGMDWAVHFLCTYNILSLLCSLVSLHCSHWLDPTLSLFLPRNILVTAFPMQFILPHSRLGTAGSSKPSLYTTGL